MLSTNFFLTSWTITIGLVKKEGKHHFHCIIVTKQCYVFAAFQYCLWLHLFHTYSLFRQELHQLLLVKKSTRCLECHLAPILAKLIAYFCAVSACISRRIQVRETFNKKRFRCESAFVFSNSTRPRSPGIWTFF